MNARIRSPRVIVSLAAAAAAAGWVGVQALGDAGPRRAADLGGLVSGRALAARLRGTAIAHEIACARGSSVDCGIAAAMLREGDPDDLARAAVLGARATGAFGSPGRVGAEQDPAMSERACIEGDAASCTVAARLAAVDGHAWRVAALHQLACDAGDPLSCETALRAREAALR